MTDIGSTNPTPDLAPQSNSSAGPTAPRVVGAAPRLVLLPAVDVAGGQAVRLTQGEVGSETNYGSPVDAALDWAQQGAEWIHLVDLDAAFGRGNNRAVLREVLAEVSGVQIELSGGIRDDASLEQALDMGATRVNLGTAALEDPDWADAAVSRYGERVAVGLDVRGTTLAARGWTKEGGDLWQVLERLEAAGCSRYVVTDVTKDGTLRGPNFELLRTIASRTAKPVIASGGVSNLDDLRALRELVPLGVEGAIVGKALYAGQFTLRQALAVAGGPVAGSTGSDGNGGDAGGVGTAPAGGADSDVTAQAVTVSSDGAA